MGSEQSILIDYDISDINIESMFISFHVGYIGDVYYGNVDHQYTKEFIYSKAYQFIKDAQNKDTILKIMYKSYFDSFTHKVRKEILILEDESQEKMTRNILQIV